MNSNARISLHRSGHRGVTYLLYTALCLVPLTSLAAAPDSATQEQSVTAAEVYQQLGALQRELDQIRLTLGKRLPRARSFKIENADTRQTYFQAQTLFRKTNALAQEVAGISREVPPIAPDREIASADVLALVVDSREQLGFVKEALGIEATVELPRLERKRTASDVLHDIVEASYVLNRLSSEQVDWSTIYDRLLQMITYIGGALPEADRYPQLPPHEGGKLPQDVYAALSESLVRVGPVAESVDLGLVRIITRKQAEGGASSATVFDLTTTMLSDLAELTLRLHAEDVDPPDYPRPPRIFPSHALQLARVLGTQIEVLNRTLK